MKYNLKLIIINFNWSFLIINQYQKIQAYKILRLEKNYKKNKLWKLEIKRIKRIQNILETYESI